MREENAQIRPLPMIDLFRGVLWELYGAGDAIMRESNRVWTFSMGSKRITVRSDYFDQLSKAPAMDYDISDEDDPSFGAEEYVPYVYDRMEELGRDLVFSIEYNGMVATMKFRTPLYVVDYMHFTMLSFDGEKDDVNCFGSIPGRVPEMPKKTNGKLRTHNFRGSHHFPRWMIYYGDVVEADISEEMAGVLHQIVVNRQLTA